MGLDRGLLTRDDSARARIVEVKDGCGLETQRQLAEPPVAEDEHRLRRLAAGAALRADVIGGRKLQRPAVPEGGMVARMIVGVSAQNVEYDARVKFGERRCGIDEPVQYHGRDRKSKRMKSRH